MEQHERVLRKTSVTCPWEGLAEFIASESNWHSTTSELISPPIFNEVCQCIKFLLYGSIC